MSNPFLNYDDNNISLESLTNGTANININSAKIQGLSINLPTVTDSNKKITSSLILQSQVLDLVDDLADKLESPLTAVLDCGGNNIINCPNLLTNPLNTTFNTTGDVVANYNTTPISLIAVSAVANGSLQKSGGTMTGSINLNNNNLNNVNNISSSSANIGTSTGYATLTAGLIGSTTTIPSTAINNTSFLNLSGGTMTGDINMNANAINSTGAISGAVITGSSSVNAPGLNLGSSTGVISGSGPITIAPAGNQNININSSGSGIISLATSGTQIQANSTINMLNNSLSNVSSIVKGAGATLLIFGNTQIVGSGQIDNITMGAGVITCLDNLAIQPVNDKNLTHVTTGTGQINLSTSAADINISSGNIINLSGGIKTPGYTGYLYGNGLSGTITASPGISQSNITSGNMATNLNMNGNNINGASSLSVTGSASIGNLRINQTANKIESTAGTNITIQAATNSSNLMTASGSGNNIFSVSTGVNSFNGRFESNGNANFFNNFSVLTNGGTLDLDTGNNSSVIFLQAGGGDIISGGVISAPLYTVTYNHAASSNAYVNGVARFVTSSAAPTIIDNFGFTIGASGIITPSWSGIRRCRITAMLSSLYTAGTNDRNMALWFQPSGLATIPAVGDGICYGLIRNTTGTRFGQTYSNIVSLTGGTSYQFAASVNDSITYTQTLSVAIESLLS